MLVNTDVNHAGYLAYASTKTVTCVEASWIEPLIECSDSGLPSDMTIYVAIAGDDGHGHDRVEKAAAQAYCSGALEFYTEWTYTVQAKADYHVAPFLVFPGDHIWAQVSASGHTFKMTLADLTKNKLLVVTSTVKDATRSNAQWDLETSYSCAKTCAPGALARFGSFTMTGAEAVINGVLATVDRWPRQATNMGSGPLRRATVSKLGRGTFTVTWRHR
jgi:Peptidase A4 family